MDLITKCNCNECGKNADIVVQLGQEPDYESATANICLDCLKRAVEICEYYLTGIKK